MSGRTTAEIVTELREAVDGCAGEPGPWVACEEAADRLAEQEVEIARLKDEHGIGVVKGWEGNLAMLQHLDTHGALDEAVRVMDIDAEYQRIQALRLPCPTCGDDGRVWGGVDGHATHRESCPDCSDGKVSHERAWAIVRAVFDDQRLDVGAAWELQDRLRSVSP